MKISALAALALLSCAALLTPALAQKASPGFEKNAYNNNDWTKGHFSDVVTTSGPGTTIYLAGITDLDSATGKLVHPGDFLAQCRHAYDSIKNTLALHNAKMSDIVKITTYVTDIRSQADYGKCRGEALGAGPLPTHTFIVVAGLASAGMLIEVDATAVIPR